MKFNVVTAGVSGHHTSFQILGMERFANYQLRKQSVVQDLFTEWPLAFVADQKSDRITRLLVKEATPCFGMPKDLLSDRELVTVVTCPSCSRTWTLASGFENHVSKCSSNMFYFTRFTQHQQLCHVPRKTWFLQFNGVGTRWKTSEKDKGSWVHPAITSQNVGQAGGCGGGNKVV